MDMDTCCAYFCTGLSIFGLGGLLFMFTILQSGGEWYLGVSKEEAPAAANACLVASAIYAIYLVYCGLKLKAADSAPKTKVGDDDD